MFPDPIIEYDFENVYNPGEDSYLILDFIKNNINSEYFDGIHLKDIKNILDMGTGTGIIATMLAIIKKKSLKFNPSIYASDILDEAISLAKRNAELNSVRNEIVFIKSDLFTSFPSELRGIFDIIFFNPPYLPSIKSSENVKLDFSWNGGRKGFEIFIEFLHQAKDYLNQKNNPRIYYICSSAVNLDRFYEIIEKKGFKNKNLDKKRVFMEEIYLNRLEIK
ncbi:MAG: HemK2/MTQ2 family protein methyltransferase [Promethearchaeota archaeon]